MGILSKVKSGIKFVAGGAGDVFEGVVDIGGDAIGVAVDLKNRVIRIGDEIFLEAPGELFTGSGLILGDPASIAFGLYKNEVEDELVMLNPFGMTGNPVGLMPVLPVDPIGLHLVVGDLTGLVEYRHLRDDELQVARHVFRRSIERLDEIIVSNLASVVNGEAFASPLHGGGGAVHLGRGYRESERITCIPLLMHELTHIWQLQVSDSDIFQVCEALGTAIVDDLTKSSKYDFEPDAAWSRLNTEAQASVVQAWMTGHTRRRGLRFEAATAGAMSASSPLFRMINANVRRGDDEAGSSRSTSVRKLLDEGRHTSVRKMIGVPPAVIATGPWWTTPDCPR